MDLSAQQLEALNSQLKQDLGLSLSPFLPVNPCFYDGAQRQHNLETLRHLAIFGDMTLLLTGASGAGKTRLLEEFSRLYSEEVNVLMLSAFAGATQQGCLTRLALLSGIQAIESEPVVQTLSRLIQKYDVDYQKTGKRTTLIIDDSDQLPESELKLLYSEFSALPPESGLVLLLAGSTDLAARIKSSIPPEKHDRVHQVVLKPFTQEEVLEYLLLRLKVAGYTGILDLNEVQLDKLMDQSKGLPGLLHQCFASIWYGVDEQEEEKARNSDNVGQRVLFGLAGLLLFSFVFVSYQHGLFDSEEEVVASNLELEQESFESKRLQKAEERDRAAKEAAARLAMLDKAIAEQSENLRVEKDELEKMPQGNYEQEAKDERLETESAVSDVVDSDAQNEDSKLLVASETAELSNLSVEDSVPKVAKTQPAQLVEAVSNEPEKQESKSVKRSRHPGFRSEEWITKNLANFTLQVLGSYNEETARRFTESVQGQNGEVVYIETVYKSKPWFVVLYGSFDSKDLARKAGKEAPEKIKKQKPWLRSFTAIADSLPQ